MPRYIDWFLVELESQLRDRIRLDQVHSVIKEAHQHLSEAYDEHLSAGMSDEDAQLAAMERFGSPSKIAAAELGQSIKGGNPQASAWAVGVITIAAVMVPSTVGLATSPVAWAYCLLAVAGLVLAFAILAYFSRRLLLLPVAVIVLASAGMTAMISSQRFVMETSLLPSELPSVTSTIEQVSNSIEEDLALLQMSETFFSRNPNRDKPFALNDKQGYIVPLGTRWVRISASVGYISLVQKLSRGSVMDWNDAKKRWSEARRNGYMNDTLSASLHQLRSERNRLYSFNSQFPADVFSERMTECMAYGGIAIAGLWAINSIVFGLGKIGRGRRAIGWLERRLA
jgi:hypothetical protein